MWELQKLISDCASMEFQHFHQGTNLENWEEVCQNRQFYSNPNLNSIPKKQVESFGTLIFTKIDIFCLPRLVNGQNSKFHNLKVAKTKIFKIQEVKFLSNGFWFLKSDQKSILTNLDGMFIFGTLYLGTYTYLLLRFCSLILLS